MDLLAQRSLITKIPIVIVIPGFVDFTANDILGVWHRISSPAGHLFIPGKVYITAKGAGSTNTVQFVLQISTNSGSSFSAAHSGTLDLATSSHNPSAISPTWSVTPWNDGDLLRLDLTQSDPAAYGIQLQIHPAV